MNDLIFRYEESFHYLSVIMTWNYIILRKTLFFSLPASAVVLPAACAVPSAQHAGTAPALVSCTQLWWWLEQLLLALHLLQLCMIFCKRCHSVQTARTTFLHLSPLTASPQLDTWLFTEYVLWWLASSSWCLLWWLGLKVQGMPGHLYKMGENWFFLFLLICWITINCKKFLSFNLWSTVFGQSSFSW